MKQKLILLFALWLFAGSLCPAQTDEVAFRASAPEAVAMGQQFKIVYTLTNAQGTELRAPNWSEDFRKHANVHLHPDAEKRRNVQYRAGHD